MYTLTVYKNLDEKQPIVFKGRISLKATLDKLATWMDKNNGSFDLRNGERPMGVDGLTVFDGEDTYTLLWDTYYHEWSIEENGNIDSFETWVDARDEFLKIAYELGEWEW